MSSVLYRLQVPVSADVCTCKLIRSNLHVVIYMTDLGGNRYLYTTVGAPVYLCIRTDMYLYTRSVGNPIRIAIRIANNPGLGFRV
jgi:hypothetical protein